MHSLPTVQRLQFFFRFPLWWVCVLVAACFWQDLQPECRVMCFDYCAAADHPGSATTKPLLPQTIGPKIALGLKTRSRKELLDFGFAELPRGYGDLPTTHKYAKENVRLKELAAFFGFSLDDIIVSPGSCPDLSAVSVTIGGGRCYITDCSLAPKWLPRDPETIVDAIVHFYEANDSPRIQLISVAEDDSCLPAVNAAIADILRSHAADAKEAPEGSNIPTGAVEHRYELVGNALRRLFPEHRFFVYQWSDETRQRLPPGTKTPIERRGYVGTLAIAHDGGVFDFAGAERRELFGGFLAKNSVKLENAKDARLIWNAFCEICRWDPHTNELQKVSDREWHLGVIQRDGRKPRNGYYDVRLNDDLTVQSAKWAAEEDDSAPSSTGQAFEAGSPDASNDAKHAQALDAVPNEPRADGDKEQATPPRANRKPLISRAEHDAIRQREAALGNSNPVTRQELLAFGFVETVNASGADADQEERSRKNLPLLKTYRIEHVKLGRLADLLGFDINDIGPQPGLPMPSSPTQVRSVIVAIGGGTCCVDYDFGLGEGWKGAETVVDAIVRIFKP